MRLGAPCQCRLVYSRKFRQRAGTSNLTAPGQVAKEATGLLETLGVSAHSCTAGDNEVRSPISGEVIGRVASTSPAAVGETIEQAYKAFNAWRKVPAPQRGELIRLFAEELRANKAALGRLVT